MQRMADECCWSFVFCAAIDCNMCWG
jgi:hypothetical protein